jgi:hypothetical protein
MTVLQHVAWFTTVEACGTWCLLYSFQLFAVFGHVAKLIAIEASGITFFIPSWLSSHRIYLHGFSRTSISFPSSISVGVS